MISKELTAYFDELRIKRGGMSQLEMIDGIISATQFRRYLNGESKLPFRVIVDFSERLGLKYDYVLDNLNSTKNNERRLINKIMNSVVTYNFDEFDRLVKEIDNSFFIETENKLIYDYILILNDLFRSKIRTELALYKLKKLIDYPKILIEKEILSIAEFMILGEIATLLPVDQQVEALERLKRILKKPQDVITGNNEKLVIMLLVRIIKTLGVSSNFDEALSYCLSGIKICKATQTLYSLDYLYYYASLCYNHMNDFENRDKMIFLTIMASHSDNDSSNSKKFMDLIKKDFEIDIAEFIKKRL